MSTVVISALTRRSMMSSQPNSQNASPQSWLKWANGKIPVGVAADGLKQPELVLFPKEVEVALSFARSYFAAHERRKALLAEQDNAQ